MQIIAILFSFIVSSLCCTGNAISNDNSTKAVDDYCEMEFKVFNVNLIFSTRNISFKSNKQWKKSDGIPETFNNSQIKEYSKDSSKDNLKCPYDYENIYHSENMRQKISSKKKKYKKKPNYLKLKTGCDVTCQSCLDQPNLDYESFYPAIFKVILIYSSGNVTFFTNKLWVPEKLTTERVINFIKKLLKTIHALYFFPNCMEWKSKVEK